MKFFNNLFFIAAAFFLITLSSCTKDVDIDHIMEDPDLPVLSVTNGLLNRSVPTSEGLELECINILYPFSMIDADKKIYKLTSQNDFNALEQDSTLKFIIGFIYPLTISTDDNQTNKVITNDEALYNEFAACTPDEGWSENDGFPAYLINAENSCYKLIFPVNLKSLNLNTAVAKNEAEFNELIASDQYFFQFPITLEKTSGGKVTIQNINEFFEALFECNGSGIVDTMNWESGFSFIGCYELIFPFDVALIDGSVKTINDDATFGNTILQGKLQNFMFPINLKKEDNTIVTASSQSQLDLLIEDCSNVLFEGTAFLLWSGAFQDSTSNQPCYEIVFPINVIVPSIDSNGQIIVVASNLSQLTDIVFGNFGILADVQFPLSVILDNNSLTIIEDKNKLNLILESCD